jgi:hypothetical protein
MDAQDDARDVRGKQAKVVVPGIVQTQLDGSRNAELQKLHGEGEEARRSTQLTPDMSQTLALQ